VRWAAWRAARRPAEGQAPRRAWPRARSRAGVLARHQAWRCQVRAWAAALDGRERAAAGRRIQVAGPPCPGPSRTAWSRVAWSRPGSHRSREGSRRSRPGCCQRGVRQRGSRQRVSSHPGSSRKGRPEPGWSRPGWRHQGPRRRGRLRPARAAEGPARAGSASPRRRCVPARGKARKSCLLAGVPAAQAHLPCPGPSLNVTVGAIATARRNFPPVTRLI
jgi:hypothetical protein